MTLSDNSAHCHARPVRYTATMDIVAPLLAVIAVLVLVLRRPGRAHEAIGAARERVDAADRAAIEARAVAAAAEAAVVEAREVEAEAATVDATDAQAVADAIAKELARVRQ